MAKIEVKKVTAKINPKNLVKVGRLKQVADSLSKSAEYKNSALKQMIPTFGYEDDKVRDLLSSQSSDTKSAAKYNKIILGAKKK